MTKCTIALVGRPNVGKSTLFNRLSIRKKAIVHNMPGVTRDRKYSDARISDLEFTLIDTPGLEESEENKIEYRMMEQTMIAISEADLICLMIDHQSGITPDDQFFAGMIRKLDKQAILIVNKCEKSFIHDKGYYKIGFGDPIAISAEHGQGMADLYDAIKDNIDFDKINAISDPIKSNVLQIAVVGRPNAGKSTFINAILNDQRMLTGPEAGITRESIEIALEYKKQNIKLIDTAGLRKKSNIKKSLEVLSKNDTIGSIRYANTVVLMVDATIALEHQDLKIASYVVDEGRSIVIAVNKWDLIHNKKEYAELLQEKLETHLTQARGVPVIYLSSINNKNTTMVIDKCMWVYELWNKKISTSKLNNWLQYTLERHPLPIHKKLGRRVRIKYITQTNTRPPTFKLFSNDPDSITDDYKKYLVRSIRDDLDLPGVPIRLYFAKSDNPYAGRK